MKFLTAAYLLPALSIVFGGVTSAQQSSHSMTSAGERQLTMVEQAVVHVAELMPESRYYFSPDSLQIAGSDYKGVRTFAAQVKHLASDNDDMWSVLTGESVPPGGVGVEGPPNIRTKDQLLKYLKDSFAMGHRAMASLTQENSMDPLPFRGMKLPRVELAFWGLIHSNDHYGQMVVYLRMCGITPSATIPK